MPVEPWGTVELEPEVANWLASLDDVAFGQAEFAIDRLEREGVLLGEPYTRQLAGKLRELRFFAAEQPTRVTYFVATGRRIILLTVFAKTRSREAAEVRRAMQAMAQCQEHGHDVDDEE